MTPREVSRQLRQVQEKHKDDFTPTFNICLSDMARDSANAIDNLLVFVDHIGTLPTCNTCCTPDCQHKPRLGANVRLICPLCTGVNVG